jgi:hypothetical protein
MTTARREYFLLIGGLILLIITGASVYYIQRAPNRSKDMADIKTLVTNFTGYEKSISVTGPTETVKSDIQQNYGQFITVDLLQQWRADPLHAPGRLTSSPWPDHIVIDSVSPQGAGYNVSGHIIMMASTGDTGSVPVVMLVIRENNAWKIAAYQEAKTE